MTTIADLKAFTAQVETWHTRAQEHAKAGYMLLVRQAALIAAGRALGLKVGDLAQMLPTAAMTEVAEAEDLTAGSFEEDGGSQAASAEDQRLRAQGEHPLDIPGFVDASKRAKSLP